MNSYGIIGAGTQELFIKEEKTNTAYCVHFNGCQEKSLKRIAKLLYHCSLQINSADYNDSRKRLKYILAMAAKFMKCDCSLQPVESIGDKWLRLDHKGILRPIKHAEA